MKTMTPNELNDENNTYIYVYYIWTLVRQQLRARF